MSDKVWLGSIRISLAVAGKYVGTNDSSHVLIKAMVGGEGTSPEKAEPAPWGLEGGAGS